VLCILKVIDCIVLLCIFSFSVYYFLTGQDMGWDGRGKGKGKEEGGKGGEGLQPQTSIPDAATMVMTFSKEDMTSLSK